jgi:hypothetical protein
MRALQRHEVRSCVNVRAGALNVGGVRHDDQENGDDNARGSTKLCKLRDFSKPLLLVSPSSK